MERRSMRLADIAARCGGEILGDPEVRIGQVATLRGAKAGEIAFLAQAKYRADLAATLASAVIVGPAERDATALPRLVAANPYACFARVSTLLNPELAPEPGVHPGAYVADGARIASSASVGPGASIGAGAEIGERAAIGAGCAIAERARVGADSRLHPHVTVYPDCILGARVIVHAGAVIGADGFGFAPDAGRFLKIPQIGRVVIGDDVEIGANSTIDRGAIEDTVIEEGVKIDNQVQIGHNCRVGAHSAIAGCVGIAGSTTIGRHCMIGGAAMIGGHLAIADRVMLAGGSTVTKSIAAPGTYVGVIPAEEARVWRRMVAGLRGLDRLIERVRRLERQPERARGEQ